MIDGSPAREWLSSALENRRPPPPSARLARHHPDAVAGKLLAILADIAAAKPGPATFLPQAGIERIYQEKHPPPKLLTAPPPSRLDGFPQAVIFDIYGTLLDAAPGGVRDDPAADPVISRLLRNHGLRVPPQPTAALAALVRRDHAASPEAWPEIDLVALWAELLGVTADARLANVVAEIEDAWHPAVPAPGALAMLRRLARAAIPCGLLSNAQSNAWRQLGPLAPFIARDLAVFSHQHRRAKPSPALFGEIVGRLARRGIAPCGAWFVGNDPANDIEPARDAGFRTVLIGPAANDRPADLTLATWDDFMPDQGQVIAWGDLGGS
jgi:FMN phosphatase YigB (HAD superfamily)